MSLNSAIHKREQSRKIGHYDGRKQNEIEIPRHSDATRDNEKDDHEQCDCKPRENPDRSDNPARLRFCN